MPSASIVLDMGAETCMAIRIGKGGVPLNIVRNDRCASGTGRSLKMAAKMLGKSLDEMGALSLLSQEEISINNTCAVFAESEIISKIHNQYRVEDIAKAVFQGLARRAHSLIIKAGQEKDVAMVGGLADNAGMIRALQDELGCAVLVPDQPMIVGALGAALIAREKCGS
jgi:predicted CoA-substrate-specific enzyme activase